MMKKTSLLLLVAIVFCSLLGMGNPNSINEHTFLSEASISNAAVLSRTEPVAVSFTRPMVDEAIIATEIAPKEMPFSIYPPVVGSGHWATTQTFIFTPEEDFIQGRKYFVQFRDDLQSKDGKKFEFLYSFSMEPQQVTSIQAWDEDISTGVVKVELSFDKKIAESVIKEHLVIRNKENGKKLPCTYVGSSSGHYSHVVEIPFEKGLEVIVVTLRGDSDTESKFIGFAKDYVVELPVVKTATAVAKVSNQPSPLLIRDAYISHAQGGEIQVHFYFTDRIAPEDMSEFITVYPEHEYTVSSHGDEVSVMGVSPGSTVKLSFLAGLQDASGRLLTKEVSYAKAVGDRNSFVEFTDSGGYLTSGTTGRVGLKMANIDQLVITLHRQYENNLPFSSVAGDSIIDADSMMHEFLVKEIPLSLEKNEIAHRAIDLQSIVGGKNGLYKLVVHAYRKTDSGMRVQDYVEKKVFLTDLGVTAREFPSGITVFTSSIHTGKPIPHASIQVYSASNQLMVEGTTDTTGVFVHSGSKWEDHLKPATVVVKKDEDLNVLSLRYSSSVPLTEEASRAYLDKGYEAFLYTPRGVFRPGEKVDIKAFVRDNKQRAPQPFPIKFHVISSRGLDAAEGAVELSIEGGADFSFTLPKSAASGSYIAKVVIPGQEAEPLGVTTFSVEDFVPPRLEVALTPTEPILLAEAALPILVSGQYLFGAPGAGLAYELGYSASQGSFAPTGYELFTFGDAETRLQGETNLRYYTGTLDETGEVSVDFTVPGSWNPQGVLSMKLIAAVQEDGGRWVNKTGSFEYFPTPYLLGLPREAKLTPRAETLLQVAAVTPQGQTASDMTVKVEFMRVEGAYRTVYRNNRYEYIWTERLLPLESKEVEIKDGLGSFSVKPSAYGQYSIRCSSLDGKVIASMRIYAWDDAGGQYAEGGGRLDVVELEFDKVGYLPGDVAKLSVKSPFAGTLFIGVERSEQLVTKVVEMSKPSTIVEVPVTADMHPNASITAWVYRPVTEEDKGWFPHRASGSVSLPLSVEAHTLHVDAQVAEKILPNAPVTIPFWVTDVNGSPVSGEFSVAFVDEGVLSLTNFITPEPAKYFMALRKKIGSSYDIYDALLRPEARIVTLLETGGDEAQNYQGSLSTELVYLMAFLPTVRTDSDGKGEAVFAIPEYSGKGRLMIVGAAGEYFASAATSVHIARDIVVEVTSPRVVAPDDTFAITVNAFTTNKELKETANVVVKTTGPVALQGETEFEIPLNPSEKHVANLAENQEGRAKKEETAPTPIVPHSGKKNELIINATALAESSIATIDVEVSVPGREDLSFTKSVEVAVRAPFPRVSAVATELIPQSSKKTLTLPNKWVKGTTNVSLTIGKSPVFAVLPALDYLREYPYACLEQLTSRAWPYLVLPELERSLSAKEKNDPQLILQDIVSQISAMQTIEGGFSMWPGGKYPDIWRSLHAIFFLVEARSEVTIPKNTLSKALGYARLVLRMPEGYFDDAAHANTCKAYAVFILQRAGEKPTSWMQVLTEQENNMNPSGQIFLAGAKALHAGNPDALLALKQQDLLGNKNTYYGQNASLESATRNRSLLLMLWSLVAPEHSETQRLCKDLAEDIGKKHFFTTQEAGMASLAFGRYLEGTGSLDSDLVVDVLVDGNIFASANGKDSLVLGTDSIPVQDNGAPVSLTVQTKEKGQAYAVYSIRGIPLEAPTPASSHLQVEREWYDAAGERIDMSSGSVTLQKGEQVTVTLRIASTQPVEHLVVSDVLPGGVEVENTRLQAASEEGNTSDSNENTSTQQQPYTYIDQREDRVLIFFTRIEGSADYTYTMRAIGKGTYTLPPLAAEGMYNPEINAITGTGKLIIE